MTASATPQTEPFGAPGAWEILNAQAEVIDAIARGAEFYETLRCIALIVERLIPPAICSILLVDDSGRHLRHGAGPSLPDAYKAAIDGIEIGPTAVACGGAAFRRETVIVADVADAPLLENYRPLALQLGLRACWSHPIIDEGGTVLGVFALYHPEPGAPAASDLDLIDRMARLVRVALTQQRREKALRETEQRLRDYVSVASDWLWEQDSSHRLTFVSRNIEGSDLHSLLGKTGWEVVFEGADAAAVEAHKADLDARRPFRNFRVRRVGRHGRVHALNISGMPIYDDTGRFCGYRGVAQDVSKQATAEEASRRSKLQAIEANRAKTEFLANVSHELRTPLNAILGFSEMMKGAMLGPISPRYREYAADIHASGQYLDSLVTSLLDLSRIEMGRVELFEEAADIAEIIDDSFRLLAMRAREQGVDLSVEPLPDLPRVWCDRLRLKQALVNLISNAVKFTPRGGAVAIAARMADHGMAICVRDTGIGMRSEDIQVAMEPFRQIDPLLSRRYGGVGLGLALSKSLIELHGGRLELESAVGAGTTATIHLPAARIMATGADASAAD